MLFIGFYFGLEGISQSRIYNLSVGAFTLSMKVGGFLMLAAALLCWIEWRPGLGFDAVLTAAIGVSILIEGIIWLVFSDLQGLFMLIFSLIFLNSARQSWNTFRSLIVEPVEGGSVTELESELDIPRVDADQASVRAEALKRVLEQKRGSAAATIAQSRSKEPAPVTASVIASVREIPPSVESVRQPIRPPEPPRELPRAAEPIRDTPPAVAPVPAEPPPSGFLAELGKDD